MMKEEEKKAFEINYSAPTESERREIESIRRRYLPEEERQDKLTRMRAIDKKITDAATASGVSLGIAGTLIFGTGMCMVMEWALYAGGVVVSVIGAAACACAYPFYKRILRRGREKHADEILRLGDELLGGKERSENDDAHTDADGGED